MTYPNNIPVIDFNDFTNRSSIISTQVLEACTSIGFFYITNHQIPKNMVENAFTLVLIKKNKEIYQHNAYMNQCY